MLRFLQIAFLVGIMNSYATGGVAQSDDEAGDLPSIGACLQELIDDERNPRSRDLAYCLLETVAEIQAESTRTAEEVAEERLRNTEAEIRSGLPVTNIQRGEIHVHRNEFPELVGDSLDSQGNCIAGARGHRGGIDQYRAFETPFATPPEVFLSLNHLAADTTDVDIRIYAELGEVTTDGFHFSIVTWCTSRVHYAQADWIAFGN